MTTPVMHVDAVMRAVYFLLRNGPNFDGAIGNVEAALWAAFAAVQAAERERCCRIVAVQRDDDRYDVARRTILAIRAGDDFHDVDDDVLRA